MKKIIRVMLVLVLALVSFTMASCEDEGSKLSAEEALQVLLVEQDTYVSGDFEVTGSLFYKGTKYDLVWTSDNACLSVAETVNDKGNYLISVARPETEKQVATLTASLTIGSDTKTKEFTYSLYPIDVYEISDAYSFKYANKAVKEGFALDTETSYEGKKATITWSVPEASASILTINGNNVEFEPVDADTLVQLVATFSYNGEEAKRPFSFTLVSPVVAPTVVTEFQDGDTFKLGLNQEGLGAYIYFSGVMNGYYMATTENGSEAADVTIHVVEGGYQLSFVDDAGKTQYIEVTISGKYINPKFVETPTQVWTYNTEYDTFTQNHLVQEEQTDVYLGAYGTYNTIGGSKISYAKTSYPCHMYILPLGPVAAPNAGEAYKLGTYQGSVGKTLYFTGKTANKDYYFATTEDSTLAVDVVAEAVEGGYHLSFTIDGAKKYLDATVSGTYVNAAIVDAPTLVWTYDSEYYTYVVEIEGNKYYLGTYNTYETISLSKYSYISTSYPCRMYAPGGALPEEAPEEPTPTEPSGSDSVDVSNGLSIETYAAANGWTNATAYSTINYDANTTITASGTAVGSYSLNTGKFYDNGKNWRIYQTESGTVSINSTKKIASVKVEYEAQNGAILAVGSDTYESGVTITVNGNTLSFTVGQTTEAENGQLRITKITIVYA